MTDLNDWVIAFDDQEYAFGREFTDYPFKTQVSIGPVDRDNQDAPHPIADGLVMGKDFLRGFTMQFDFQILRAFPSPEKPWQSALDLYNEFAAIWRGGSTRLTPGSYATLTNLDRSRMVYGRPRAIAPKFDTVRSGFMEFQADFQTNSPDFYDAAERVAFFSFDAPTGGALISPLESPLATIGGESDVQDTVSQGNLPAWPVVEFHGPCKAGSGIDLLNPSGKVVWTLKVGVALAYDEEMVIDTRPWSRSATINGRPANGKVRGTAMNLCTIPVGDFNMRYKVNDESGTAFCVVHWHDTYASL